MNLSATRRPSRRLGRRSLRALVVVPFAACVLVAGPSLPAGALPGAGGPRVLSSCTFSALKAAVAEGGAITFGCHEH
jgi:ABC-type sulfate transport system permease component